MASFLCLTALAILLAVSDADACAFPRQACYSDICSSLNIVDYGAVLDGSKFDASTSPPLTSFSSVGPKLGYFYTTYNTEFNGGVYDNSSKAKRDGAPFINWIPVDIVNKGFRPLLNTLASCCDGCRQNTNCTYYIFDANLNTDNSTDPPTQTFDGTGDCYFVKRTNKPKIDAFCSVRSTYTYDDSVDPKFVGGLCNPSVVDDPHFVGARGTRFDFNGEVGKSFCLVADKEVHVNALLGGYVDAGAGEKGVRTWMKEVGFIWRDASGARHTLHLVARRGKEQARGNGFLSQAMFDANPAAVPTQPGSSLSQPGMTLSFLGTSKVGRYEVDKFRLVIGDVLEATLALRVAHPKLQKPDDAEVHFNLNFENLKTSPAVHGVLGQTYRATLAQRVKAVKYTMLTQIMGAPVQADGQTGKGFLEGEVQDYVTSSVTAPDCKFASF